MAQLWSYNKHSQRIMTTICDKFNDKHEEQFLEPAWWFKMVVLVVAEMQIQRTCISAKEIYMNDRYYGSYLVIACMDLETHRFGNSFNSWNNDFCWFAGNKTSLSLDVILPENKKAPREALLKFNIYSIIQEAQHKLYQKRKIFYHLVEIKIFVVWHSTNGPKNTLNKLYQNVCPSEVYDIILEHEFLLLPGFSLVLIKHIAKVTFLALLH